MYKMCTNHSCYYRRCRSYFKLKKVTDVRRGTVYTKCVQTVPVTAVDEDFPLNLKNVTDVIRGKVYRKCVQTVPVTTVDADFLLKLKKLPMLYEERCIQNVYRPFLLL